MTAYIESYALGVRSEADSARTARTKEKLVHLRKELYDGHVPIDGIVGAQVNRG